MKKIILISMLVVLCVSITACTSTHELNLSMSYNQETQNCIIENTSNLDYEDVVVNISLEGKDGFVKKIAKNIGDLKEGEKTSFKITDVSEKMQVYNVVFESFDYYVNPWLDIILPIIVGIIIFVGFVVIIVLIN